MGQEGFGIVDHETFESRLTRRVERAGWGNRLEDTLAWLREIAGTPLPYLDAPLSAIVSPLPEMEFWFPERTAGHRCIGPAMRHASAGRRHAAGAAGA